MEDTIEVILEDGGCGCFLRNRYHPTLTASTGALLAGFYGVWSLFAMPGFRRIPRNLLVPYVPSGIHQTENALKLLEGRRGRLADLGSGDGRLVFAAASAGFQCTGFEINPMLLAYARGKALWRGIPPSQATFANKDFWKSNLSEYNNVTAFLAPGVMDVLGGKLLNELPNDARVIACRFPFPNWPHQSTLGYSLDQTWAYDIGTVRSSLRASFTNSSRCMED